MGWQWHQLDHMQIICTSLQTDNHASTSQLSFYRPDALPAGQPTASKHCRLVIYFYYITVVNLAMTIKWLNDNKGNYRRIYTAHSQHQHILLRSADLLGSSDEFTSPNTCSLITVWITFANNLIHQQSTITCTMVHTTTKDNHKVLKLLQ